MQTLWAVMFVCQMLVLNPTEPKPYPSDGIFGEIAWEEIYRGSTKECRTVAIKPAPTMAWPPYAWPKDPRLRPTK